MEDRKANLRNYGKEAVRKFFLDIVAKFMLQYSHMKRRIFYADYSYA